MCCEPTSSIPAADLAIHILDHLYLKLDEACLVQDGEVVSTFSLVIIVLLLLHICVLCGYLGLCNANLELVLISGGHISDAGSYICWKLTAIH